MKKVLFIAIILLAILSNSNAQTNVTTTTFGNGELPSVVITDAEQSKIAKITANSVKAKVDSYVICPVQRQAYIVEYDGTYKVTAIDYPEGTVDPLQWLMDYTPTEPYSFTSTRVSDVRNWLKDELIKLYHLS